MGMIGEIRGACRGTFRATKPTSRGNGAGFGLATVLCGECNQGRLGVLWSRMDKDTPSHTEVSVRSKALPSAASLLAIALGAAAFGAIAIGAVAIGRLAVGRLVIKRARFGALEVDELTVRRLRVLEHEGEHR
jgi:hypothetical protein